MSTKIKRDIPWPRVFAVALAVFAIALVALVLAVDRDVAVIPVDRQETQAPQSATTARIPGQSLPANSSPDVQTSDAAEIAINWYQPPHRKFLMPNGSWLENYDYYKLFAESGSGIAAYQLANMMSSCSGTFLRRAELDEAIVQMRQTFTYRHPGQDSEVRLGEPEKVDEYIEGAIEHFELCKDFTAEQREEHDEWMELAANNGHTTAMLDYGRRLDDPVAALELYRRAWRQGDGSALHSLAVGLERTYDEGIDPAAKIPAFAAMHAYVRLLRTAHGSDPDRVVGRLTLRNQARLDEMAREMYPEELEKAVELAGQLILSNENCCYSM